MVVPRFWLAPYYCAYVVKSVSYNDNDSHSFGNVCIYLRCRWVDSSLHEGEGQFYCLFIITFVILKYNNRTSRRTTSEFANICYRAELTLIERTIRLHNKSILKVSPVWETAMTQFLVFLVSN